MVHHRRWRLQTWKHLQRDIIPNQRASKSGNFFSVLSLAVIIESPKWVTMKLFNLIVFLVTLAHLALFSNAKPSKIIDALTRNSSENVDPKLKVCYRLAPFFPNLCPAQKLNKWTVKRNLQPNFLLFFKTFIVNHDKLHKLSTKSFSPSTACLRVSSPKCWSFAAIDGRQAEECQHLESEDWTMTDSRQLLVRI